MAGGPAVVDCASTCFTTPTRSALSGSMGAERVHPSGQPNRPVKRTASIDITAQAAHERAEALEEAVRRHEYAVEMAASNGDVVVANRSRRAAAHAREGACLPVVVVNPKEDPGNLRMDSVPVVLASVNRGVSDRAAARRCQSR